MKTPETQRRYDEAVVINVDLQNDFALATGALAVPDGELVVPVANRVNDYIREQRGHIIFTQDWHPSDTTHFMINHAENEPGGPWPVHCLQNKAGAALHDDLNINSHDVIAHKGMSQEEDGYSGWNAEVVAGSLTALVEHLPAQQRTVGRVIGILATYTAERGKKVAVIIEGLATDYCDKDTVLDALDDTDREVVDVFVVTDAMRAVDINEGDGERALQAMLEAKAIAITSEELINGGIVVDRTRLER